MSDPTSRKKLHDREKMHEQGLEQEIEKLLESAKSAGIKVAAIGGTLLTAYLIAKKLQPKAKREKGTNKKVKLKAQSRPTALNGVANWAAKEVSIWLLITAQKRLVELIGKLNAQKNEHTSKS